MSHENGLYWQNMLQVLLTIMINEVKKNYRVWRRAACIFGGHLQSYGVHSAHVMLGNTCTNDIQRHEHMVVWKLHNNSDPWQMKYSKNNIRHRGGGRHCVVVQGCPLVLCPLLRVGGRGDGRGQ